jgi:hypothetical protein
MTQNLSRRDIAGALSWAPGHGQYRKLPDKVVRHYGAALQQEVLRSTPTIPEATWRAAGFQNEADARAVMGDDAIFQQVCCRSHACTVMSDDALFQQVRFGAICGSLSCW